MALLERSVAEQRYEAVMQVLRRKIPVSEVASRFGVSRQSVHSWIRRYEQGGLVGLVDRSHRPRSCPDQIAAEVEAKVCELRRAHPKWGPQWCTSSSAAVGRRCRHGRRSTDC
jgi:transposase-like protein